MSAEKFFIEIIDFYWINGDKDDPEDKCLHGNVNVKIGNEVVAENYPCTVSSTALYLLKSLQNNHIPGVSLNQMLPCCGFFIIPNDTNDTVEITGCLTGIDWTVIHENHSVKLITQKGHESSIDIDSYRLIVFDFVDKVEKYYNSCKEKILPADDFDLKGYLMFWKEWHKISIGIRHLDFLNTKASIMTKSHTRPIIRKELYESLMKGPYDCLN